MITRRHPAAPTSRCFYVVTASRVATSPEVIASSPAAALRLALV